MHANAVETLLPFLNPGAKVLDIGTPPCLRSVTDWTETSTG